MPMTLYDASLSPFTTRNRIQIRAKGIENEIALVARPADRDAYRMISPSGRMPCLDTGDGVALIESETISEFIEDAFPERSLRGEGALGAAKVRLFSRLLDIYFHAGLNILFGQFSASPRDPTRIEEGLAKLEEGLNLIEHYLPEDELYATESRITLADCALVPAFFYANVIPGVFGKQPFLGHDKARRYYARIIAEDAICKRAVEEMGAGLQAYLAARAA